MEHQEESDNAKPIISNLFIDENIRIEDRFSRLKGVHQLQRSIVRQNMHNVMSPISAISGYLELINMSLSQEPDIEQIEYYRKKIESGIHEVNTIMEQLQSMYNDDTDSSCKENDTMLDVDLNWIVREVCSQNHFDEQNIEFRTNANPLHIRTDIFISKLILFNLINYAVKNSSKKEKVEMTTDKTEDTACFSVKFRIQESKVDELKAIVTGRGLSKLEEHVVENSFNEGLLNSTSLAQEIEGSITLSTIQAGLVKLKLNVPLSYMDN